MLNFTYFFCHAMGVASTVITLYSVDGWGEMSRSYWHSIKLHY